ncbi:hypothetical protein WKK05_11085 [Nostoc sp. UHCC 0302]|uniref:hypothetical protein n=1 Tax=Nostoc sp. UHCC 0302 TaxID=3134896 RepID=UPI00311CC147
MTSFTVSKYIDATALFSSYAVLVLAIALPFSLSLTFIGMDLGFFMTLPTPE